MLTAPNNATVATHWGRYRACQNGASTCILAHPDDSNSSPIGLSMLAAQSDQSRILRPAVRASFLEKGHKAGGEGRGREPFVEVGWDEALNLAAAQLERVSNRYSNEAIYGGSYGWGSAGRFNHAQSQIHRFLNTIGGYTRSVQHYSFAAGLTIVPYVIGSMDGLGGNHTSWDRIIENAELVVMFGGVGEKNAQVNAGGLASHKLRGQLEALRRNGAEIVSVSPIRDDTTLALHAEWLAVRPTTDVALMLGVAHTLLGEGLADRAFLDRYTVGFDHLEAYLLGKADGVVKDAAWAGRIADIPPETVRSLARRMAARKTFLMMSWSLQRAEYGEQPYWMLIALASMLGQIGKPGTGYGFGYGAVDNTGFAIHGIKWPSLPQGVNNVSSFIPVARISDMLLNPGAPYPFNGQSLTYPDIRLVYWAGGNPFHHHQDINRLCQAWRRPEVVIAHELQWNALAKFSDIVFPVASQLERNDLVCSSMDNMLVPSHRVIPPPGEVRSDFEIFSGLAARFGKGLEFTEGLDEEGWLRRLYDVASEALRVHGLTPPEFDDFWASEGIDAGVRQTSHDLLADFVFDPFEHPLPTPSGRIELFSERIASFGYADCSGHPVWLEPREWLGAAGGGQLHMISNQPVTKLHSQLDNSPLSRQSKIKGREPIRIHPDDAAERGIVDGDVVRVHNERGGCLAGAVLSAHLRRGVVQLSTGAWYDPVEPREDKPLDAHGNPNVLTADRATSALAQGPSAQSCLVRIERFEGPCPPIRAFDPPEFQVRRT